jgi:hypothetical protein
VRANALLRSLTSSTLLRRRAVSRSAMPTRIVPLLLVREPSKCDRTREVIGPLNGRGAAGRHPGPPLPSTALHVESAVDAALGSGQDGSGWWQTASTLLPSGSRTKAP